MSDIASTAERWVARMLVVASALLIMVGVSAGDPEAVIGGLLAMIIAVIFLIRGRGEEE